MATVAKKDIGVSSSYPKLGDAHNIVAYEAKEQPSPSMYRVVQKRLEKIEPTRLQGCTMFQ